MRQADQRQPARWHQQAVSLAEQRAGIVGCQQVKDIRGHKSVAGPVRAGQYTSGRLEQVNPRARRPHGESRSREAHHDRADVDAHIASIAGKLAGKQLGREASRATAQLKHRAGLSEVRDLDKATGRRVLVEALGVL